MKVLIKVLNEAKAVNRLVSDFHDDSWVEEIIVVDGGSNDLTVPFLLQYSKVKVFVHPWLHWYHNMECTQSNIVLSYMSEGEIGVIIDADERFSEEAKKILAEIDQKGMPDDVDTVHLPRRTFEPLRFEDSPVAMLGEDGWPLISHQIGQYPDHQCRVIRKKIGMHWVNSPHHIMFGNGDLFTTKYLNGCDILHYEKDDLRDREAIEARWLQCQVRRQQLSIEADVFETSVKPEYARYVDPDFWRMK